jgi:hypothetical protein
MGGQMVTCLAAGATPHTVVTGLIRDVMTVAQGEIHRYRCPGGAGQGGGTPSPRAPEAREELISSIRATPLDPAGPALDLLEDLLTAIHGCWLIFCEYEDLHQVDDEGADDLDADGEDARDDLGTWGRRLR